MNIVVCVKQTPDTTAEKKLNAQLRLERTGIENVMNPYDEYAIEECLRLREQQGGEVTALCMGPDHAQDTLRRVIAMGADRGVLVTDPALAGSDWLATARVLAAALKKLTWDIVVFGMASTDSTMSAVPSGVAELLDLPQLSYANRLDVSGGNASIHRQTERGFDVITAPLPCIISVTKGINEPRYPSLKGIMASRKAEVKVWSLADVGLSADDASGATAKTKVLGASQVSIRRLGQIFKDDGQAAAKIADFLESQKIL